MSRGESPRERRNPRRRLPQSVTQQNEHDMAPVLATETNYRNVITREYREISCAIVPLSIALAAIRASRFYPLAEPPPAAADH